MNRVVFYITLVLLLSSCGEDRSMDGLKETIEEHVDALQALPGTEDQLAKRDTMRLELIASLLDYYHTFPDDVYAPECLDKVHFVYSAMRDYRTAAKYGDTLLLKYPDYINREMVIESQYNTYDMFVIPRNKEKVAYYLNLWLEEYPDMDAEKRKQIERRLSYIDLTIEKMIELQAAE